MLKTIVLALNPLEPETWTTHYVEDVRAFLFEQFKEWPSTARIYNGQVSEVTNVTPFDERSIEALDELNGPFYVIVYPAEPATIFYAVVAILVVATVVMSFKKIPNVASRNNNSNAQSANNELSERVNKPRLNGRIPDIYGTVRSTPDLISLPYKIFVNNIEVEYSYMCIGRGSYDVSEIKDDTTRIVEISGSSVEIYGPNTSPNFGVPQLTVGPAIGTPVLNASRLNAVNGQVLLAPNGGTIQGNRNIRFVGPNKIQLSPSAPLNFTTHFEAGQSIGVANSSVYDGEITENREIDCHVSGWLKFPASSIPSQYTVGKQLSLVNAIFNVEDVDGFVISVYNLSGTYTITAVEIVNVSSVDYCKITLDDPDSINLQWDRVVAGVTSICTLSVPSAIELYNLNGTYTITSLDSDEIVLFNPSAINAAWSTLGTSPYISPTIGLNANKWIGPFMIDSTSMNEVYCNFVATNGMYKDNGENQISTSVALEVEITPVDVTGSPVGTPETFGTLLVGSDFEKSERAVTLKMNPTFNGRCKVRARRTTNLDKTFSGQVVDEVKWRDCYAVSYVDKLHFGNVTTVQSVTYATTGALAVKERKLNMLVTRKIPHRVSGSTFTTELLPTNSADDIISAICTDQFIGNRSASEIDFDSIYNNIAEVKDYFGIDAAGEFCYTFDSDNLSFEETVKMVADSVFCNAFRRGNIIKLGFEKTTDDSTLLFNHRNKLPNSETRTIRFGNQDKFDGVSYQYVDPNDDAIVTYHIPNDQSAVNPREIESIGVRSGAQAYFHAWREWNKIRYQNTVVEFEATQEANLLAMNDRILVADNTRVETQDGEIESQSGLVLTLSVSVDLTAAPGYTMFVQYSDGVTEGIALVPGSNGYQVTLATAPRIPLVTEDGSYAKTTFVIVGNTDTIQTAFLVTEKSPKDGMTSTVTAVNYDARYYGNDDDFINGDIDENGNYI